MPTSQRTVSTDLIFDVVEPATIVLNVRPAASAGSLADERLEILLDGVEMPPPRTIEEEYGGLLHIVTPDPGRLEIRYRTNLLPSANPSRLLARPSSIDLELLEMTRPSRYCPSDHVAGLAHSEFGDIADPAEQVAAIAAWIFERIGYVSGSTDIHDTAEHTLLTGQGVCRDFAHLGILLCRALDVPARFAAVYAPGLFPMDFHAVFEAWHDDGWWAYDTTRLAPRQTLVRIGTGRDAADTSFATVTSGIATLLEMNVGAFTDGDLPLDNHGTPIALP